MRGRSLMHMRHDIESCDKMEKIVEKGQAEVKKIVDNAKKVLEGA